MTHILLLLLPFSLLFRIDIIGRLHAIELVLAILFIYHIVVGRVVVNDRLRKVMYFLSAWLVASVVSDFVNDSAFNDLARGWSRLVFLAIDILALSVILDCEEKWLMFFMGSLAALSVEKYLESDAIQTYWKFGVGLYLPLLISAIIIVKLKLPQAVLARSMFILWISFSIISLAFNCRSLAVGQLIAALLSVQLIKGGQSSLLKGFLSLGMLPSLVLGGGSVYMLAFVYGHAAEAGWIGIDAQQKLLAQRLGGVDPVVSLIFGGRSEIFASAVAISDAPIFGHGSWAKGEYYVQLYKESLILYSGSGITDVYISDEESIPTHSHILGAWVDSGFIGALFWLYIFLLIVRSWVRSISAGTNSAKLFALVGFYLVWDIMFSPFGALGRYWWALLLQPVIFGFYANTQRIK